jgi:hypothetical protein
MGRLAIALVVVLTGFSRSVAAQSTDRPAVGDRVRVAVAASPTSEDTRRTVGILTRIDETSLAVAPQRPRGGRVQTFSIDAVRSLEVSAGSRSNVKRGALIGGLSMGALSAIGQMVAPCEPDPAQMFLPDPCDSVIGMGVWGLMMGAVLGGVVGNFVRTDVWRPAPTDGRAAQGGRPVGIRVSVAAPR